MVSFRRVDSDDARSVELVCLGTPVDESTDSLLVHLADTGGRKVTEVVAVVVAEWDALPV